MENSLEFYVNNKEKKSSIILVYNKKEAKRNHRLHLIVPIVQENPVGVKRSAVEQICLHSLTAISTIPWRPQDMVQSKRSAHGKGDEIACQKWNQRLAAR